MNTRFSLGGNARKLVGLATASRDRKLALSFALSLLTTGSMVTAMYLKDTSVYNPYISMNYPLYVLVLVVGTVLVWRCMAAIVGVDE